MAQQYEKKELRQHIYDTPDTYVGGIEPISILQYIPKENKNVAWTISIFRILGIICSILNSLSSILSDLGCYPVLKDHELKLLRTQINGSPDEAYDIDFMSFWMWWVKSEPIKKR